MEERRSDKNGHVIKNLDEVNIEIACACKSALRPQDQVTLIAVSKGHEFSLIQTAYHHGQRDFGESYAQEMAQKMAMATAEGLNDINWHFIGAIQSNKLKLIKEAHVVHSIGSARHAELLNDVAERPIDIFLQVNLEETLTRQGVYPREVPKTIERLLPFPQLRLRGLMAILPQDPGTSRSFWFEAMVKLKASILQKNLMPQVELSMGMSHDYIEAIGHGANFIRIGTRIFGPRQ